MRVRAVPTAPFASVLLLLAVLPRPAAGQTPVTSGDLAAFQPRPIGPAVTGGRVSDIEADPAHPSTVWVATATGGLWKSTNRGQTWTSVFDTMAVSTFGDVALAPSDPDVVYAGTGEQNNRQSTSWGGGVYRSDDGGRTWRHLGLQATRHVGKIEVDPRDPDVAWVAALGNLWAPSPERGVYRTADGGRTWQKVLFVDDYTGAVDLVMNPSNPDVVYAATYQRLRSAWGFNGGGPGSAIWKTVDGGRHWERLGGGLPPGDLGRIGLALARSDPRVVMAVVQTADPGTTGTYRSTDGGASWARVNPLDPRPMYYSEIFIDPTDADVVYVLGTESARSDDGGRTFTPIAEAPSYDIGVHADHHALWIDPSDPEHLYLGEDGGVWESYDRGARFRKVNNLPIGQFYAIAVDVRDPYRVYGGMQDTHSWMGPSETRHWSGILGDDWKQIGFSDGMHWAVDPTDWRFAYGSSSGGNYFRFDGETGDLLDITPVPPEGEPRYRFDWTSPLLLSPHDPSTVYVAGNRLFVSHDRGGSWERTSDLSKQIDRDTLRLMGVADSAITISPNDGTSSFGEAVTLDESPLDAGILWVGFDDGNLQVSRDAGRTWSEVSGNVPGLPPDTYVSRVTASRRGPGVAYATFDAHRSGDFAPYVYRTDDYGRSWTALGAGLPEGSAKVIVEHPDDPDVLFLGTEHHLFVSTDAGRTWARQPNLPTTLYDDLVVHPREKDLVIATHGRSVWILDDTRPLVEWSGAALAEPAHLFSVAPATLFQHWKDTSYRGNAEWRGENPPDGALVTYHLGAGTGPALLRITAPDGAEVRAMEVPSDAGLHRVTWDLRHAPATGPDRWAPFEPADPDVERPLEGRAPLVSPGTYTLTLEARGVRSRQQVEVRPDPLLPSLTTEDYQARERFLLDAEALAVRVQALAPRAARSGDAALPGAVRRLRSRVRGLVSGLEGSGVEQGSLHPPTETMRGEMEDVRGAVEALEARLPG